VRDDTESRPRARRGNRLALAGLFAVFVVPILTAYALNVWWPHWSPFGRMNHGELVRPAWEIELDGIAEHAAGRWILLHPVEASCDKTCEARLDLVKRVHVSLGKDYDRVVRIFVHRADVPGERPRFVDTGLIPVPVPDAWFDRFGNDVPVLLIVDPQRRAVLRYGSEIEPKGLARDLARVLKISKIG